MKYICDHNAIPSVLFLLLLNKKENKTLSKKNDQSKWINHYSLFANRTFISIQIIQFFIKMSELTEIVYIQNEEKVDELIQNILEDKENHEKGIIKASLFGQISFFFIFIVFVFDEKVITSFVHLFTSF